MITLNSRHARTIVGISWICLSETPSASPVVVEFHHVKHFHEISLKRSVPLSFFFFLRRASSNNPATVSRTTQTGNCARGWFTGTPNEWNVRTRSTEFYGFMVTGRILFLSVLFLCCFNGFVCLPRQGKRCFPSPRINSISVGRLRGQR